VIFKGVCLFQFLGKYQPLQSRNVLLNRDLFAQKNVRFIGELFPTTQTQMYKNSESCNIVIFKIL